MDARFDRVFKTTENYGVAPWDVRGPRGGIKRSWYVVGLWDGYETHIPQDTRKQAENLAVVLEAELIK